jgi:hypothetical protein
MADLTTFWSADRHPKQATNDATYNTTDIASDDVKPYIVSNEYTVEVSNNFSAIGEMAIQHTGSYQCPYQRTHI